MRPRSPAAYLAAIVLLLLLDQSVKALATATAPPFDPDAPMPRVPISVLAALNTGSSMLPAGALPGGMLMASTVMLGIISAIALWRFRDDLPDHVFAAATIGVAGALGNGLDRVLHGGVVDFLAVRAGGHLLIFNLADTMLLVAGVVVSAWLLTTALRGLRPGRRAVPRGLVAAPVVPPLRRPGDR